MEHQYTYEDLLNIVETLRSENGCPWDKAQTHESLRPCMMEEAAELVAAVRILKETDNYENLREELGDILLQVVMHSRIATEEGYFTMEDVVDEIAAKMVRRHPHVFGDCVVQQASEVPGQWEEIKKKEKEGKSWITTPLREVPPELPALARATKVMKKTDKLYHPIRTPQECIADMNAYLEQAKNNSSKEEWEASLGELLLTITELAAGQKIYTEQVLQDRIEDVIDQTEGNRKRS